MKRNLLVTGGAGYIGSHTCKALASAGYQPITYDNLSTGHRWAVKWGPLVVGDLADKECLCSTMLEFDVQAVLHFAAHAYVGESMTAPRKYFHNNVVNSLSLLDAMLDAGVRRIVFSSSCATYGNPQLLPIGEEHIQIPVNPYGETKLCVEKALRWYEEAYGLRSVTLRYFNAAGADPEGEIGECHDPETHLIPLAIAAAQGTIPHLTIFGSDYATPDGTPVRDYVHVSDLASAHVKAVDRLFEGSRSLRLNLGTGQGYSVREVISAVAQAAKRPVPIKAAPRRSGDPASLIAGAGHAKAALGWTPQLSEIGTIVDTAWHWHVQQLAQVGTPALTDVGRMHA
jgi:UDP-arabinose 4-epimerase